MNRVITINLNGVAYQLEESGYEALRVYLDNAARRLEGNPDKDEILADIEQAIADKFRALLGAHKTVVVSKEVSDVITQMGPVQDASGTAEADPAGATTGARAAANQAADAGASGPAGGMGGVPRRLFRINDGAMLAGVCNGIAAYLDIDVTIVRVLFALLALGWGTGILIYILMAFILPEAQTPAEKAAAYGGAATAQEFIRRAKAGYYDGMKTFRDKRAHREWKSKFRQEMRGWKHSFKREARANAFQWQSNWNRHWGTPQPRWSGGAFFLWPLFSLLRAVCVIAAIWAIVTLVGTGAVLGVTLPVGIPLWVGIVGLVVICHFITWPLKAMRHACWYGSGQPYWHPFAGLFDGLVGIAFLVLAIWIADHYVPQVHEVLSRLPAILHHAVDQFREWWSRH